MRVAVIGGGPAGLMAAEAARAAGATVSVFEKKRSVGRKLLVAGKGGLNLTHAEPLDRFLDRYGSARARVEPYVRSFPPEALRALADGLGQTTWVGSSGRVFPKDAKAAPLLRAWVSRLKASGVSFFAERAWNGWEKISVHPERAERERSPVHPERAERVEGSALGRLSFADPKGAVELVEADATVLALGGASWPQTGSDGRWVAVLRELGVEVAPLEPANAGWVVELPPEFSDHWQGHALKSIALSVGESRARGDVVLTRDGMEGTPVYRLCPAVRSALAGSGIANVTLDLRPDSEATSLETRLARGGTKSRSTRLKGLGLDDAPRALAGALLTPETKDNGAIARALKALPLRVTALRPIEEAISSAGGVRWEELDEKLMLRRWPGVFVAGEMIDWEAPTGGYLLQACFSTGRAAGDAAARWLREQPR